MNITRLRIPTGRRQTSWLSTSAAEKLNSGLPRTILASGQSGIWTLRISNLALQPLGHATSITWPHPGSVVFPSHEFLSVSLSFSGAGREVYHHFPGLFLFYIYFKLIYIFWRCVSPGRHGSHFSYGPHISLSRGGIEVFDLYRQERWQLCNICLGGDCLLLR